VYGVYRVYLLNVQGPDYLVNAFGLVSVEKVGLIVSFCMLNMYTLKVMQSWFDSFTRQLTKVLRTQ